MSDDNHPNRHVLARIRSAAKGSPRPHSNFGMQVQPLNARREADAYNVTQLLVSPKIDGLNSSSLQLPAPPSNRGGLQGQSLTLQQQHFHSLFARRLGMIVAKRSVPLLDRPHLQDDKIIMRCCRVALIMVDRCLKQCQLHSQQYCKLRQHYTGDIPAQSPAAFSHTQASSVMTCTFRMWRVLVVQQHKQRNWAEQFRISWLAHSFYKLRHWSHRDVVGISCSALIRRRRLGKVLSLWRSRSCRNMLCRNRCDRAKCSQARGFQKSAFSFWKLYLFRNRRVRVLATVMCRRLRRDLICSSFDAWRCRTNDAVAFRNAQAWTRQIKMKCRSIITNIMFSKTFELVKNAFVNWFSLMKLNGRLRGLGFKEIARVEMSTVSKAWSVWTSYVLKKLMTRKLSVKALAITMFERKARVCERGFLQRAVTEWRHLTKQSSSGLRIANNLISRANKISISNAWAAWIEE